MDERNFSAKSRVSFGVRVPNSGPLASPDSIVQVGREAESLGYDSIWVHDHLTWTEEIHSTHISSGSEDSNTGGSPDFYEAMTTLAYLAGLVRSVRLGVACLVSSVQKSAAHCNANCIPGRVLQRPTGHRPRD